MPVQWHELCLNNLQVMERMSDSEGRNPGRNIRFARCADFSSIHKAGLVTTGMQAAGKLKRVLIADPDNGIRRSMDMFLKEHYVVYTASDGHQVLELLKNEDINLLIIDARLEGIYIFELLRLVKEMTPDLPVIVMYVYLDETQHVEEYIRKLADACVVKPFQNDSLVKTIDTLLNNNKGSSGELNLIRPPKSPIKISESEIPLSAEMAETPYKRVC